VVTDERRSISPDPAEGAFSYSDASSAQGRFSAPLTGQGLDDWGASLIADSENTSLEFQAVLIDIAAPDEGGLCDATSCWPPHRSFVGIADDWHLYEVYFDDLMPATHHGTDLDVPWDASRLAYFRWLVQGSFDLGIDSVCFIE